MKLYYSPGACSLADHIALAETGSAYSLERVDLKTRKTASGEDYTQVNPKGYVPALVLDDGDTLTENVAILSYIAEQAGTLRPRAGIGRWHVLEAVAFISTEIHKGFKPFHKPGSSDEEKQQGRDVLAKRFGTAAEMLGDREFLVGDELSVADCYLFVMLQWAEKFEIDMPGALPAYYRRLKGRPAFQRALSEEQAG